MSDREYPTCLVEWPSDRRRRGYTFRPAADPRDWTLLYPGNLVAIVQFDSRVVVSDADDTVYDLWLPNRDVANRFMARLPSVIDHEWVRDAYRRLLVNATPERRKGNVDAVRQSHGDAD